MKRILTAGVLGTIVSIAIARWTRSRPAPSIAEQVEAGLRDTRDGWWVRHVLDAFRFLETDYGYALAEVQMHFKGNYIRYRGPAFVFVIEYDPEATRSIGAEFWVVDDEPPGDQAELIPRGQVIDVNRLLRARDPGRLLPETQPSRLDQDHVTDAVTAWAQGLRELASDVLAGAWPADLPDRRDIVAPAHIDGHLPQDRAVWSAFDPTILVDMARVQRPEDDRLPERLAACTRAGWTCTAYAQFVPRIADGAIDGSIILEGEHQDYVIDFDRNGTPLGIELLGIAMSSEHASDRPGWRDIARLVLSGARHGLRDTRG